MNQPDTFEDSRVFKNHRCQHSVTVVINCGSPLGKQSLDKHITKPLSEYKCFEESIERNFASEYKKVCNVRFLEGEDYALFGLLCTG